KSRAAVRELIWHILHTSDMTIALTPHVMENDNNDHEILRQYYEEFKQTGRVILLPDNLTAVQYKGYIARMRFFIGARTHATIAAYSSCVPTMVLGYSVKSKGIAIDIFGRERLVLGIADISDSSKLIGRFDEMLMDEAELVQTLRKSIPNIKRMSYKAVDYLKQLG
ncbi:polysaccharide pyruvyl transferase family protein, partial [Paenibacillus sepulcri]|nr:polysaccharide pyruvyl transferase family protein [Paenibacillus sepulcri]